MAQKTNNYGNDAISALKGADRVRKRPGVIFGSDGLEGCEHAVFEIMSNAIDEAREGHGNLITVTRFEDLSIQVEDQGRGCPVDWNPIEKRYNWELVYCELYAGGKYDNNSGEAAYEYSLGMNGLGACATQYSSEYMDVTVWRDGNKYELHFKKGKVLGKKGQELTITPADRKKTGTTISATTAGRMPLKAASTTGFWRMPAKKMAIARMMTNDGVTVPSRAAAAPRSPRTL